MRNASPKKAKAPVLEPPAVWRIPYKPLSVLWIGWSLLILILTYQRSQISIANVGAILGQWSQMQLWHPYLLTGLMGFIAAAWILAACILTGQWVLDRWWPEKSFARLERMAFGAGIGMAFLSNAVLVLGALRLWYASVFYGLLAAMSLLVLFRKKSVESNPSPPQQAPWGGVWIILLVAASGLFLLGTLSPEIFFDTLHYHLAIPNLYRLEHRIFAIPSTMFANYVMALHMLYGLGITIGNTLTAKFLHLGLMIILGMGMVAFGRRYLSPGAGVLSILIYMCIPVVSLNLITAGIDAGWSALQFLAVFALIRALDVTNDESGKTQRAWLWLAGGLAGYAASCKYVGFPFLPVACVLIIWQRWKEGQNWRTICIQTVHFTLAASLFVLPQLIKNYILNGNPIYPFLGTHWGRPLIDQADWNFYFNDQNPRDFKSEFSSWSSAIRFILHPWFLTFDTANHGSSLFGPLYLAVLPVLFFIRTKSVAFRTLLRYSLLAWLLWIGTSRVPRYGLAALAMASPLLAEALLMGAQATWARWGLLGTLLMGTLSNLAAVIGILYTLGGWTVVGGLESEKAYLGAMHASYPTPPYDGLIWMNENLPPTAKFYALGDSRTYYSSLRSVPSSTPGWQHIMKEIRASRDGAELMQRLREQGVTHLFLNMGEAIRTENYHLFPFNETSWEVFSDFWNRYVRLVWKVENPTRDMHFKIQYVYELLPEAEAARPHEVPMCPLLRWAPAAQKNNKVK